MTIIYAYSTKINELFFSQVYDDKLDLASLATLNNWLGLNPGMMSRPYLCKAGLISSLHCGTIQYNGMITKHDMPQWFASKDFRGTIDFYYSLYEWPFQICFHPQGFLGEFVIDRIKNGFTVPNFTRQIRLEESKLWEAHEKYAWESREQIGNRVRDNLVLSAK